MSRCYLLFALTLLVLLPTAYSASQIVPAETPKEYAKRTEWFRDAKFGMFIHWGVYSVLGRGEWVMLTEKIPAAEYEKLPPQFNPTRFNATEWVGLAKRAGQKYILITSKHHDGFAMFDSKVSDYDIIDRTPFTRDPTKELAEECRKQGIKFGFYHSILDWHHPDYTPAPAWDKEARASHEPDFDNYLEYMRGQVRELCTNYGPLACIWWDGGWEHNTDEDKPKFAKINAMVRQLQPDILINDRANIPEDFGTPEQYIPATGLTAPDGTPRLWENCITLTTGHGSHQPTAWWGYDKNEKVFKTPEFCIRMLVDVVSKGGNLLLNVGPTPDGTIRREEVEVLEAMGKWLEVNGEAIYGTTASPFRYLPFYGKATVKGDCLYLHVFDWPRDGRLVLPGVRNSVRSAYLLSSPSTNLKVERTGSDVVVHLPQTAPDPIASVVAVRLDGPPRVEPFTIRPDADGVLVLPALFAEIRGQHGQRARFEAAGGEVHVGNWTNKNDYAAWQFETEKGGTFEVIMDYAAPKGSGTFEIAVGDSKLDGTVAETGSPTKMTATPLGQIELPPGTHTLTVKAVTIPEGAGVMNLRRVTLKPVKQTELGIEGTHFTLNGKPAFLLGISYYGALGAPKEFIVSDLDDMQRYGFNWIRVWATWAAFENDVSAVDAEGNARKNYLDRLLWLIEECDRRGMVVDVTLSRGNGTVGPPRLQDPASLSRAVQTLVSSLRRCRNWYLDLGNERSIKDKRFVPFDELVELRKLVKHLDPKRLITASYVGDIDKDEIRKNVVDVHVDFLAPHRPRNPDSPRQTMDETKRYLRCMEEIGRTVPLHYQEPFRRGYQAGRWEPKAEDFLVDLKGAKQAGAAGWCFHNGDQKNRPDGKPRRSFDMRETRLFDQLDAEEMKVVREIKSESGN